MQQFYTDERHIQILIFLLKAHGIRKIIVSPGATNVTFVGSVQCDPFFQIYSSVDERSAAYMACGLAAESGEPVALNCTGATAARNYIPGLTEAFYRKLPIVAITSSQPLGRVGHLGPQVTDRSTIQNDIALLQVTLDTIHSQEDEETCVSDVNKALLELNHRGGGPVHINVTTTYSLDFSVQELPPVRVIKRYMLNSAFPELPNGKIAIWAGAHPKWSQELTESVDRFCELHDAVVFCDHTSNYHGRYRVLYSLVCSQVNNDISEELPTLLIHIGEISGDVPLGRISTKIQGLWRVNPDGEPRDLFRKMTAVFEMDELSFFNHYSAAKDKNKFDAYLQKCLQHDAIIRKNIPSLPLSNIYLASQMASRIPANSVVYFGILNSLRSWNFFNLPADINCYATTGGFGIEGCMSSLLGASLTSDDKLYFAILGDLSFFYDMNSIGNRHLKRNIRILLVNNGLGIEFRNSRHNANAFGDAADIYMAAKGHFGGQSRTLVKHYAEDLGFEYLSISTCEEVSQATMRFLTPETTEKPMLLEVFTNQADESLALETMINVELSAKTIGKHIIKNIIGESGVKLVQRILK